MTQATNTQNGWRDTVLSEAINLIGGGTPKTKIPKYWNGDIFWLSVVDFNDDHRWVYNTEKTITQAGLENSSTKLLRKGDLIISARGTVGALAQLKRPMAFNQSCYGIRKKEGISHEDFLYYLVKYSVGRLLKNVHGAVFDTVTRQTFENIQISLPPLPEQKAIAAVLSSLDDKIELLREQNKTLEDTAQAIFREWFGKYRVDDELPEGWATKSLSKIADFLNGIALQKFPAESEINYLPVIKIRELKSGITNQTDRASKNIDQKYIVEDGDVLFSWSGSLELVIWKYGRGALNQHLFKVTSKEYPKWFYYFWIYHHLEQFRSLASAKATTMGHIQRHHLDEALVYIPDSDFMRKAHRIFEPMFEKIIANNAQIQTLSTLRDTLLPRLMRGEVRVDFN